MGLGSTSPFRCSPPCRCLCDGQQGLGRDPVQQALFTAWCPSVMSPEPVDRVGVALAEVARGAGGDQIGRHRQPTTGQRADMIEGVGGAPAVGAAAAPGVEDPTPEAGLSFPLAHQFCPVNPVAFRHGLNSPNGREAGPP